MEIKKLIAIGIIFLFLGVTIAPNINLTVVKASDDNDLVEVTTQACGIKGYGNTTVKLTREQYQNLEQYLVEFRARLNHTSTRGEAVPIFKEAVVELDKYRLLPKGMSVEQAQKLVVDGYSNIQGFSIFEKISYKNNLQEYHNKFCCLVAGVIQDGYAQGIVGMIGLIFLLLSIFPSLFHVNTVLFGLIGLLLTALSDIIVNFFPFAIMQQVNILSGNMTFFGLGGSFHFNKGLLNGFNGIKITRIGIKEMYLLGFSLWVYYSDENI